MTDTIAITGLTGCLGRKLLSELLERRPDHHLVAISRSRTAALADPELGPLLNGMKERLSWIEADLANFHLKNSDKRLLSRSTQLWHLAACTSLQRRACPDHIHRVNTLGTEALLQSISTLPHPPSFHYVSTAYVAGRREGVASEDELDCGQAHRNAYELSKMRAEISVRRWFASGGGGAIYRPSLALENPPRSSTNIASVFARLLAQMILRGESELTLRIPADSVINIVPADWTARAMLDLSVRAPAERGMCFHLTSDVDTRLSEILDLVGAACPAFKYSFRPHISTSALSGASRLIDCALEDLTDYLRTSVRFDRSNTMRILGDRFEEPCLQLERRAADALALSP